MEYGVIMTVGSGLTAVLQFNNDSWYLVLIIIKSDLISI